MGSELAPSAAALTCATAWTPLLHKRPVSRIQRGVVSIRAVVTRTRPLAGFLVVSCVAAAACVPPGNSTPSDAGPATSNAPPAPTFRPSPSVMTSPFEDSFDRASTPIVAPDAAPAPSEPARVPERDRTDAKADGPRSDSAPTTIGALVAEAGLPVAGSVLGPDWIQAGTTAWRIENGRLCGSNARNHGVWLTKTLPINARIEFDAISDVQDGDIKAEVWGDGRSAATSISYTNATSYLAILGGWKNTFHVLARINEHGTDRKEIKVDKESDDPSQHPVTAGQVYHFKIERTDGKTVKWSVNGVDYLSFSDPAPLLGIGHDHFGFNDWEAKVCFDNVKVTPL